MTDEASELSACLRAMGGSYASGPSDVPLLGATIGEALDAAADTWPDRLALVVRDQGVRWTYRELRDRVGAFAAGLSARGIERGDRIGIWSPNNSEWVVTQFASAKIGAILVTINPAYRAPEVAYALRKVGCKALVAATSFKTSHYLEMLREEAPDLDRCEPDGLRTVSFPDLKIIIQIGSPAASFALPFVSVSVPSSKAGLKPVTARLQFDDPINIQFTSGTTGAPKGATLTHHNILNNGYFCGRGMRLTPDDRLCIPVPFYHCFGMVLSNLACVTHGAAMVVPGAAFDPLEVLAAVEAERCTALHGVPTMFIAELEHPDFHKFDLSTLRTGIMAGAPCPVEVMRRVVDQMGMRDITIAYGMTETSPASFQTHRDDALELRVSTVGRVHPHVEAKIVDTEGRVVAANVTGELCTRGYSVMQGYWGDATRTAESIDGSGWMHTGDLATMDKDGFCKIVGRIKDLVIRGGENIYPVEIEDFLHAHPSVQDVHVFGIPDSRFGEELCAWILLREGSVLSSEDVRSYCKERISHYKVPRHVRFVESFPTTVTGKVQKFVMRQAMSDELDAAAYKRHG